MSFVPLKSLEDLNKLKIVKTFTNGKNADKVHLLEGDIIRKSYKYKKRHYFYKEIKILTHLKDCKHVSTLINYNPSTFTLYVSYCGKQPKKTSKNLKQIRSVAKKLHKKFGVVRYYNHDDPRIVNKGSRVQYDIFVPNTGINQNGEITFFDFGSDNWHITKKH
jgi:hypothetical protein